MSANVPKIELHLHLEGAAPPALIRQMADEKGLDLSHIFTGDGAYEYRDFLQFLNIYEQATSVLKSPGDFARLVEAVLAESAAHGVIHTEAFLSPDFCGGRDPGAWAEYSAAMHEAALAAQARHGISMRGVITAIRHFGPQAARETARCAQETAGDWITGFGIAGDEGAGELADFAYAFDMAREAGLGLTAHAGEWRGPDEVRAALDHLRVSRIGHGVRAIEDPALVERLAAEGVVLEVCPGSNVTLGVYDRLASHPVEALRKAGVPVTISTDDPPFFHTTMTREYDDLAQTFDWDEAIVRAVNITAARAAFCDAPTRARLLTELESPECMTT